MDGKIRSEWAPLRKVVIHRPGMEMFFGLLDPVGSLYERAFSFNGAQREHKILENTLQKEFGVQVIRFKDAIINAARERPSIKRKLIELAKDCIAHTGDMDKVEQAKKEFDQNAKYLDTEHFFNIILMNSGLELQLSTLHKNIQLNITKNVPLSNLYFMRDQQFVTDGGVVISRMAMSQRRNETRLTQFFLRDIMRVPILHEMQDPATIEGGEFMPMGSFALVGIGSRTNMDAINQLLSLDLQYKEIGVVHQPMHPLVPSDQPDPMINMHLDTYFNVASSNVVVGSELLLKAARVEIYHNEGNGRFVKDKKETTLHDYIREKGFNIINLTTLEQMSYASNFLCITDGKILAIETERIVRDVLNNLCNKAQDDPERYKKLYEQALADYEHLKNEGQFFPHKKEMYRLGIDAYPIILRNLTGGYGGAHCMTCVLSRG